MRTAMIGLTALALAACGQPSGTTEAPAAPAAAIAPASSAGVAPAAPCATSALPITGLCSDANAALFVATDDARTLFSASCAWKTQEIKLADDRAIVFRAQDCTPDSSTDDFTYTFDGTLGAKTLKYRIPSMEPGDRMSFLDMFDVGAGETAEQVAMKTLAYAPADQKARCVTKARPGPKVAGRVFDLGPNEALEKELNEANPDDPWDACGPHGVSMETTVFWEGRDHHAFFHMTGQDDPPWDFASFTFYAKGADGAWARKD